MRAKFKGTCGLCFRKYLVGDEIARTHMQLIGPVGFLWAHKVCADHANKILAPDNFMEEGDEDSES